MKLCDQPCAAVLKSTFLHKQSQLVLTDVWVLLQVIVDWEDPCQAPDYPATYIKRRPALGPSCPDSWASSLCKHPAAPWLCNSKEPPDTTKDKQKSINTFPQQ